MSKGRPISEVVRTSQNFRMGSWELFRSLTQTIHLGQAVEAALPSTAVAGFDATKYGSTLITSEYVISGTFAQAPLSLNFTILGKVYVPETSHTLWSHLDEANILFYGVEAPPLYQVSPTSWYGSFVSEHVTRGLEVYPLVNKIQPRAVADQGKTATLLLNFYLTRV